MQVAVEFRTYGPFKLDPLKKGETTWPKWWKSEVDGKLAGLSGAVGCYVFSIRAGKGEKPWYVGETEKNSFKAEATAGQKIAKYLTPFMLQDKGTPLIYLLAKLTPTGKFAKRTKNEHADVDFLEKFLIGLALKRNKYLLNKQKTKHLRTLKAAGFINDSKGQPSIETKAIKKVFFKK